MPAMERVNVTINQKYRELIKAYTATRYADAIRLAEEILANPGTLNASKLSDVKFAYKESVKISNWKE